MAKSFMDKELTEENMFVRYMFTNMVLAGPLEGYANKTDDRPA
jgi:hypothetical protein